MGSMRNVNRDIFLFGKWCPVLPTCPLMWAYGTAESGHATINLHFPSFSAAFLRWFTLNSLHAVAFFIHFPHWNGNAWLDLHSDRVKIGKLQNSLAKIGISCEASLLCSQCGEKAALYTCRICFRLGGRIYWRAMYRFPFPCHLSWRMPRFSPSYVQ